MKFGRVGEDGTVFVTDGEEERAVGSYPGVSDDEALNYFARKYDELFASAELLAQRLAQTDLSAHDARESLKTLRDQIGEANVVGDLSALRAEVETIAAATKVKSRQETEQRTAAKAEAATAREALVTEAEELAGRDPSKVQWKQASTRMREMTGEWQTMQKQGPKLDKPVEDALWQRLRAARAIFDKNRKTFFSHLDEEHSEAKRAKEKLVAEAEKLAASKDWGPTAGAFKALMQQWRQAGRAARTDDDALWERFKSAQDRFFAAKDEIVAVETAEFETNLTVKEGLLTEAESLLPVTRESLEKVKASLRTIQDKWDAAGKVPREAMSRIEGRMRKVEQAVRDVEDQRWNSVNPERSARAQSMVAMFERAIQGAEQELAAAQAAGNERKIADAQRSLDSQRALLDSARSGLAEFGG